MTSLKVGSWGEVSSHPMP